MSEKTLWPLFSKPVFRTSVDLIGLDLSKISWARNYQNWISTSQRVLEEEEFKQIKRSIEFGLHEYFYSIMGASEKVEIYFTESWVNKTEKGQSHHRHWHPNSILSGVVYLDCDEDTGGRIRFITSQYDTIEYNINEPNLYNSRSWSVEPKKGEMLIFPSNVEHMVDEYMGENPRYSLSYNTFVKGPINIDPLTRLIL